MCKLKVIDLEFNGPNFTWRGTRNRQLVEAQLDRGLVNGSWQMLWLNTLVTHNIVLGSDHCPVLVQYDPNAGKGKNNFALKQSGRRKQIAKRL